MAMIDVERAGDLVGQFIRKATNAPYIEFIVGLALVMVFPVALLLKQISVERLAETGALWPLATVAIAATIGNTAVSCVKEYCTLKYHKDVAAARRNNQVEALHG